jgi:glutathione S-transferase
MLTLYHCHDARSFRPLWTLEEMGLPYELKMLPFPPRAAAPDYLAVNPLGTVPTFFDGNMRMTESAAICQYLVTRYGPHAFGGRDIGAGFRSVSQLALFRRGDADIPADHRAALFAV